MPKCRTKYSAEWEKTFNWIRAVKDDPYKANCQTCNNTVDISNSGTSQIRQHSLTKKHVNAEKILSGGTSQRTIVRSNAGNCILSTGRSILSHSDTVLRAEILWALNCVKANYSFQSNDSNNLLFKAMFPDSEIAQSYKMSQTKCKYLIQFGIYEWVREDLVADLKDSPFTYTFDETTTIQVKKQYDAYVRYESKRHGGIFDRYFGSLFFGHCGKSELTDSFFKLGKDNGLDVQYLIQLGMDGPYVNLSFKNDLKDHLRNNHDKVFIDIGTCPLHHVHNGFSKAVKKLNFDFDGFAYDLHFFFKRSSARREDYQLMELKTEIETHCMLKHVSSRWLGIRKVLERILQQWKNLQSYFLEFLPKEKNFGKSIETTERYQIIRTNLTCKTTKLYISFVIYIANILEEFVIKFQLRKPMIHILYPAIGDLMFNLMTNFVKADVLQKPGNIIKDAQELGSVVVTERKNLKSIHNMDFGTQSLYQIGLLESKINLDGVKTEFKSCYVEVTTYLQEMLPHKYSLVKNMQYLHSSKRLNQNAVQAIREVANEMGKVLKGSNFFKGTINSYVDLVVQQFRNLQTENLIDIKGETSYSYWSKISEMRDIHGELKYKNLTNLAIACFCLSHGNAAPERGFSENKHVLQSRESMDESTVVAVRMVKDFVKIHKGIESIEINTRLMELCRNAYQKYTTYLELQKVEKGIAKTRKIKNKNDEEQRQKATLHANKIKEIDELIGYEKERKNMAESLISDGNKNLGKILNSKGNIDKKEVLKAQTIISAGIEKVVETKSKIEILNKEKSILLKIK